MSAGLPCTASSSAAIVSSWAPRLSASLVKSAARAGSSVWAASFEQYARTTGNQRAQVLADTLDRATGTFLDENRSPGRRLGTVDNRGSHFYLALYWARELAAQTDDPALAADFTKLAESLGAQEETIAAELLAVQGKPADIGGYYWPDPVKTTAVMRPSATLNAAIDSL